MTTSTTADVTSPPVASTESTPTVATEPSTTSTAPEDQEEAVLEALAGYNQAFIDAAKPFDAEHPGLDEFAADPMRSRLQELYARYANLGYVANGTYAYRVVSVEIESDKAVVVQCGFDSTEVVAADGSVISPAQTESFLYFSELQLNDGRWQVSEEGKEDGIEQPCELG